jgi:hypothetical protein
VNKQRKTHRIRRKMDEQIKAEADMLVVDMLDMITGEMIEEAIKARNRKRWLVMKAAAAKMLNLAFKVRADLEATR